MTVDFERLVDRYSIALDAQTVAERQQHAALRNAAYLVAPRVTLADAERRIVRVRNAPAKARRRPPRLLSYDWTDPLHGRSVEPVGKLHDGAPGGLDLDYRLSRTRAGDELLALVRDGIEPTVTVRQFTGGGSDLLAIFD